MAKYLDSNGLSHLIGKIKTALAGKSDTGHTHTDLVSNVSYDSTNKKIQQTKGSTTTDVVALATVATSGSYSDLSNKPTIPSAGTGSSYPAMDGTRALGSDEGYARTDHVHPTDTSRAASSHTHGNITNGGDITATAPTVASGDKIIINDESASKVTNGPSFGTDTTKYLRNDGTWQVPPGTANQNAFSNVKVGSTTIAADTTTDTLELVAGSNVTLTPDATNDKVTIAATDTKYDTLNLSETDNKGLVAWSGTEDEGDYLLRATITNDGDVLFGNTLLVASDIPDLPASKITSGTLGAARLPDASTSAKGAVTKDSSISTGSTSTNVPTSAAVATFVAAQMGDVAGALVYKGTVSAASGMANFKKGWYWIASGSFTIGSGSTAENVEAGDMLIANADGMSATAANIDVIQTNIETLTTTEIDTIWAAA